MQIVSKDNPRIKLLGRLLSSRKARSENGLFVIEGARGCADALRSAEGENGLGIAGVYYVPEQIESGSSLAELIGSADGSLLFEITADIARKVSSAETSQGIFVIAKQLDSRLTAESVVSGGKYLVLDGLQDPGNLGTMIRTADAVGITGMILTGNCVDLYNPKTVRSAVGSLPRVDIFVEKDREAVYPLLADKGIRTAAAVISGGTEVREFDFSGGCAVVIGNEGSGLDSTATELCSDRVTIGMSGSIDSLNAAAAAAILLWEMMRSGR